MFTGVVQCTGVVQSIVKRPTGVRIIINAPALERPIADGASICVSGTCLTAVKSDESRIEFDAIPETLSCSTLGSLGSGSRVNLEPALRAGDRMDGHVVQGHVDGTARVARIASGERGQVWTFATDAELMPYIIPKGSITIDGISLTIADIGKDNTFSVALIPTTLAMTTLAERRVGDRVNIETDILARTIVTTLQRYLDSTGSARPAGGLTVEMLREHGW
jgi:riboflavin synthase